VATFFVAVGDGDCFSLSLKGACEYFKLLRFLHRYEMITVLLPICWGKETYSYFAAVTGVGVLVKRGAMSDCARLGIDGNDLSRNGSLLRMISTSLRVSSFSDDGLDLKKYRYSVYRCISIK